MPSLFDPLRLGDLDLPNRVIMAPLTRLRAGETHIPNRLMADYYVQRASAGLIISEATPVTPQGIGYQGVPGIWNPDHVEGWRGVTRAVHDAGGRIFLQLWHVGRISDPSFHDGAAPVAPSAIAARGQVSLLRPQRDYPLPRALDRDEIPGVIEAFRQGSEYAQAAGFDGVELHGANGYLLDQFLQDGSNKRTDDYGGALENRARLLLEATDAAISVWGADRVGVHLAPRADSHDMGDSDRASTFGYVVDQLDSRGIAFIAAREHQAPDSLGPDLRKRFKGVYIANEGFTGETAQAALDAGIADAVAFGKDFISNPDLPLRLKTSAPLNALVPQTIYSPDATGYTDYPSLAEARVGADA